MSSLPIELIAQILQAILETGEASTVNARANTKPPWNLISSLSLTCRLYRDLVLQSWFRHFYTEGPRDVIQLSIRIPQAKKSWVKQLHCVKLALSPRHADPWDLEGYNQLELVRLDWLPSWIPHDGDSRESSEYLPFIHAPDTINVFDFRNLRWPSPTAYLFIQQCLPSLRKIILHQRKIWCGLCYTINKVRFAAPNPYYLIYKSSLGLPMDYADALKSLQFLECISINTVIFEHGSTTADRAQSEYLWTGECDSCMRLFFADPQFVHDYVSRKKRGVNRWNNDTDRPPRLRLVEWIFTPATAGTELVGHPHDDVVGVDTDSEYGEPDSEDTGDEYS